MRRDIGALDGQSFDVAIVGGGMHGAWIAMRAALAGARVALLERGDFGGATSANSLKILHGGLRYLQHLDLARMRGAVAARRAYARSFPHLFEPLACAMPLDGAGLRSPWLLGPALLANDVIGFDRNLKVPANARLPRGQLLSGTRLASLLGDQLHLSPRAGAMWWDGIARDTDRLVLEVVLRAASDGAVVANHVQVERVLHTDGRVHGLAFTDRLDGRSGELRARHVVNAAGPWAATLAQASGLPTAALPPAWTGAMNIVLRRSLGHQVALALSSRSVGSDPAAVLKRAGRELFFVPWRQRTMIGTAYIPVETVEQGSSGPPAGAVPEFVQQAADLVPATRLAPEDVALVHWGLMPLERAGDLLPRRSPVILADAAQTGARGLVTVIGEKLTSAPVVSARVLALLQLARPAAPRSPHLPSPVLPMTPLDPDAQARLQHRYSASWTVLAAAATQDDGAAVEPLFPHAAVLHVELQHALRQEMAMTLPDLLRRVAIGSTGHPGWPLLQACARWTTQHAGWTEERSTREAHALDAWFRARSAGP